MSSESESVKQSKLDDLELVRMSILRNRCGPINVQINNEEVKNEIKKDQDNKIIDSKIKLFEQGYQSLIEKIVEDATEGTYSRDAEINPVSIENFQIGIDKMGSSQKRVPRFM